MNVAVVLVNPARDRRGGVAVAAVAVLAGDDPSPLGAEWLGRARMARQHYAASAAMKPLMLAIMGHARSNYASRKGAVPLRTLEFVAERWRKLPTHGLVLQHITSTRQFVGIRDVRGAISELACPGWSGAEDGLCLVDTVLVLHRRRVTCVADAITASVNLHSLARFFRRQASGHGDAHEALRLALAALVEATPGVLASPVQPSVVVDTGGGSWRGHVANDGVRRWVNVRTFF
jgi:hypothetical protein